MSDERLKRTGEVFLVPFENIIVGDEMNVGRIDFGDIKELADSIEENGLRIPILVKKTSNQHQPEHDQPGEKEPHLKVDWWKINNPI